MDSIFNCLNFRVLNRYEAESIKNNINISYKRLPYGYKLYLKNLLESNWAKYADLIYKNFGPPCYSLNFSANRVVDIWVIASKNLHEAFYIEYWRNSLPPYMSIYTNTQNTLANSFFKWLSEK